MGHSVSCKTLRNEGLHIFRDIIKYCMKDNGEKHFEFARVSTKDMNDGTVEYMKFEKVHLNNYNESSNISISRGIRVLLFPTLCTTCGGVDNFIQIPHEQSQ